MYPLPRGVGRKKISITVYVEPEKKAAVDALAQHKRVPAAALIREALDIVLATNEDEDGDEGNLVLRVIDDYNKILSNPLFTEGMPQVSAAKRSRWLVRDLQRLRARLLIEEKRGARLANQLQRIQAVASE